MCVPSKLTEYKLGKVIFKLIIEYITNSIIPMYVFKLSEYWFQSKPLCSTLVDSVSLKRKEKEKKNTEIIEFDPNTQREALLEP